MVFLSGAAARIHTAGMMSEAALPPPGPVGSLAVNQLFTTAHAENLKTTAAGKEEDSMGSHQHLSEISLPGGGMFCARLLQTCVNTKDAERKCVPVWEGVLTLAVSKQQLLLRSFWMHQCAHTHAHTHKQKRIKE